MFDICHANAVHSHADTVYASLVDVPTLKAGLQAESELTKEAIKDICVAYYQSGNDLSREQLRCIYYAVTDRVLNSV
jgi:hypothetical protein